MKVEKTGFVDRVVGVAKSVAENRAVGRVVSAAKSVAENRVVRFAANNPIKTIVGLTVPVAGVPLAASLFGAQKLGGLSFETAGKFLGAPLKIRSKVFSETSGHFFEDCQSESRFFCSY